MTLFLVLLSTWSKLVGNLQLILLEDVKPSDANNAEPQHLHMVWAVNMIGNSHHDSASTILFVLHNAKIVSE